MKRDHLENLPSPGTSLSVPAHCQSRLCLSGLRRASYGTGAREWPLCDQETDDLHLGNIGTDSVSQTAFVRANLKLR